MNLSSLKEILSKLQKTPQSARLLAVTKSFDLVHTKQLIEAGVRAIAENRVEKAMEKFPHLPKTLEKHFIGRIQSQKIPKIVEWFDVIESVGSPEHLFKIDKEAKHQGKKIDALLQFNISTEAQKNGFNLDQIEEVKEVLAQVHFIRVIGVMGMASHTEDQELIREQFKSLRLIRDALQFDFPTIKVLSMGMSSDYHIALEEGATMVRIGSLLAKESI